MQRQYYQDTPDYTVPTPDHTPHHALLVLIHVQDSDTNPNTTASSIAGDAPADGRKRRTEVYNMRKSIYGKKHDRLGASKVRPTYQS
jgi:SWI/SNF-related matrix-associated actin-dependent regulator of chromatin subfamily A member 5